MGAESSCMLILSREENVERGPQGIDGYVGMGAAIAVKHPHRFRQHVGSSDPEWFIEGPDRLMPTSRQSCTEIGVGNHDGEGVFNRFDRDRCCVEECAQRSVCANRQAGKAFSSNLQQEKLGQLLDCCVDWFHAAPSIQELVKCSEIAREVDLHTMSLFYEHRTSPP